MVLDQRVVDKREHLPVCRKLPIERFHRVPPELAVGLMKERQNLAQGQLFFPSLSFQRKRQSGRDLGKKPPERVPPGIVFLVDDFFFGLGELVGPKATATYQIVSVIPHGGIARDSLRRFVAELEPLELKEEQQIF